MTKHKIKWCIACREFDTAVISHTNWSYMMYVPSQVDGLQCMWSAYCMLSKVRFNLSTIQSFLNSKLCCKYQYRLTISVSMYVLTQDHERDTEKEITHKFKLAYILKVSHKQAQPTNNLKRKLRLNKLHTYNYIHSYKINHQ